jgi:flagellin-like hook-associated protein FlgL
LARANGELQEALTRLSTGLRINVGKDDPAGLIASEVLRADIVSVERAISNSERANQMIATADSALGQVSSLLNDIRGLVSEAANTGAMSQEQISANQLQVDSSLEAIDRISQVTQFQGQRLLDGNLDFITSGVSNTEITDLQIDQANFGTHNQIDVSVTVEEQATRAELNYGFGAIADDVVLEIGGKNGFEAFSFAAGSKIEDMASAINLVSDAIGLTAEVQTDATKGALTVSSYGTDNDISLTANSAGTDEGNIRVKYTADRQGTSASAPEVDYTAAAGESPGTVEVKLQTEEWEKVKYAVNQDADNVPNNSFSIESKIDGAQFENLTLVLENGSWGTNEYHHTGYGAGGDNPTIRIGITDGTTTVTDLKGAFEDNIVLKKLFTFDDSYLSSDGSGTLTAATANAAWTSLNEGVTGGTVLSTANEVISAINDVTSGAGADITAALSGSDDGHEVVTAFQEYAFYGQAEANNRLQFLGPENSRDVRFVSEPGNSLGIDLSTDAQIEGFSEAIIQGQEETAFKITSRVKGVEYDDVDVIINEVAGTTNQVAVWDPKEKRLSIDIDFGAATVDDVLDLVNSNDYVSQYFRASTFGTVDGDTTFTDNTIVSADNTDPIATTSGGLVSEGTLIVNLETDEDGVVQTTADDLVQFFNTDYSTSNPTLHSQLSDLGISVSHAEGSDGSGKLAATSSDLQFATSGTKLNTEDYYASATINTVNGLDAMFTVTANVAGPEYDDIEIVFEDTATSGNESVTWDSIQKKLTIAIEQGTTTANDVIGLFDPSDSNNDATVTELFTADVAKDVFTPGNDSAGTGKLTTSDTGTMSGGVVDEGTEDGAALLGNADEANTGLTFQATDYGSEAFVSVKSLQGTFNLTDASGNTTDRSEGTDVNARVNGIQAVGKGLSATINTSALDMTFSVSSALKSGSSTSFSITGGGAKFQMGPDVVSNQQARLGISSVNTAKLGGVSGRLYELRSGNSKALDKDIIGAANIVEEVITQVTTLRGRLGAFQRTTLDVNIKTLNDTLENLTAAESDIRDADFASESAALTRGQILVQSGLSVLSIANNNPQNVLQLLR